MVPVSDVAGEQARVLRRPLKRLGDVVVGVAIAVGDDLARVAGRVTDRLEASDTGRVLEERREKPPAGAKDPGRTHQATNDAVQIQMRENRLRQEKSNLVPSVLKSKSAISVRTGLLVSSPASPSSHLPDDSSAGSRSTPK